MMTGKYVHNHGMSRNGSTSEVMGNAGTMPDLLRQAGYQTCGIGEMRFTPERALHGFDELRLPADYYKEMRLAGHGCQPARHGIGRNELYPAMATVPEGLTLTNWIANQCADYVRNKRDPTKPMFLWCSFSKPHPPLDPPEPYYSMYRDCNIPEPVYGDWSEDSKLPCSMRRYYRKWSLDLIPKELIREARAAYYGLITQIDYNMGQIISSLTEAGIWNDTLIVYTSDHGELLGDHHGGMKMFFHEPSSHIPFVLRLPQNWDRDTRCHGQVSRDLITHADILPTFLAAAGAEIPDDVDGFDLTAVARGEIEEPREYLEGTTFIGKYYAITDGRWKYMYYPEGASEQLFDLQTDPKELFNLAGLRPYKEPQAKLKSEMIRRHEARDSEAVKNGKLIALPAENTSIEDLRNGAYPDYENEQVDDDIQH
jgi:arylsulfatase A-like enzyme